MNISQFVLVTYLRMYSMCSQPKNAPNLCKVSYIFCISLDTNDLQSNKQNKVKINSTFNKLIVCKMLFFFILYWKIIFV